MGLKKGEKVLLHYSAMAWWGTARNSFNLHLYTETREEALALLRKYVEEEARHHGWDVEPVEMDLEFRGLKR